MSIYEGRFVLVQNGKLKGLVGTVEVEEQTEVRINPFGFCKDSWSEISEESELLGARTDTILYSLSKEDVALLVEKSGLFRIQSLTSDDGRGEIIKVGKLGN